MTVLIVVALLVPVIGFGSYRIQRARVLRAAHRATDQGNTSDKSIARRPGKRQRQWELRRLDVGRTY